MSLKDQLTEDMKTAMKARDTAKLGVIRFLRSEIKNYEIDHGEQDDAGVLKIIARQVKQMKDAMTEYQKGGRQDLVDEETEKVTILESYLPEQMSDQDLQKVVQEVISAVEDKNMGSVIKAVREKVGDQADGSRIAATVKELL